MRIALGVVASACLAAASAQAQSVRGQLTDSISRAPLRGAFITLLDAEGTERARTITNQAGEYILSAPTAGTYRLRSKRIGFHPYVSQSLTLRAGETISYHVVVDPIPIPLGHVVVAGERHCEVDGGASVAALWEEVREALAGVRWTRTAPGYWYEIRQFEREVFSAPYRTGLDSTWNDTGFAQVPFRSAPAELLAVRGFAVMDDDSGWTYFAPDAEVMLSDPFLRTHCFETKLGQGETAGLVGLMFSPVRGAKVPDIVGTLWVDRRSAELRHLEFQYVKLPRGLAHPRVGGHLAFMRVPTGAWVVHEWVIRMPITDTTMAPTEMIAFPRIVGLRERGGKAEQIKTSAGTLVFRSGSIDTIPPAVKPVPALPVSPTVAAAADTNRAPARAPTPPGTARRSDVLTEDEFAGSAATDAYRLVQQYRPQWLRSRSPLTVLDPNAGQVQVFVNDVRWGHVSLLRDIRAQEVVEMRYLSAWEATSRYGTTHGGGVIAVQTR
jgi:hypothetical protein